jgi:hypothetical protein
VRFESSANDAALVRREALGYRALAYDPGRSSGPPRARRAIPHGSGRGVPGRLVMVSLALYWRARRDRPGVRRGLRWLAVAPSLWP